MSTLNKVGDKPHTYLVPLLMLMKFKIRLVGYLGKFLNFDTLYCLLCVLAHFFYENMP